MSKTKILFRNRSLEMGGSENVLLTILEELNKPQYDITVLLNYRQGEFLERVPDGIKVLSIANGSEIFSKNKILYFFQKCIRRLKYFWFQKFPKIFYRKNNLIDLDYEVAFSHYMFDDILSSPNKKSKKIFWFHGDLRNSGFSEAQKIAFVEKMKLFDSGVFVSNFSKNIIENTWNTTLPKTRVIHNPLPIAKILEKSLETSISDFGKIDFISVGRLFFQKGFLDLLKAHCRFIKEGYTIRTLILGDGVQRKDLEDFITENQMEDSLILGGFQSNPFPYIKSAKYFVLPSYSEGYPLVIAEALLLNTYVLSTKVGGVSEMITDNHHGILFEPGVENIYLAMKKVLETKDASSESTQLGEEIKNKNAEIFRRIHHLFNS